MPGGHEALHGRVVVGVEGDLGLEARALARAQEDGGVRARVGGPEQPRLFAQVDQPQLGLRGQRVFARQAREHAVVEQVRGLEGPVDGARLPRRLDQQRDVDLARAQLVLALVGLGGDHRQLDLRVQRAEAADRLGRDRRAGRRERRQAQPARAQTLERAQLGLGVGEPREDDVGVADEHLARLGETDAARVALHQRRGRLAFQRSDLLRHRGLREVQRLGRTGERAAGRDLAQHPQSPYVKHHHSL